MALKNNFLLKWSTYAVCTPFLLGGWVSYQIFKKVGLDRILIFRRRLLEKMWWLFSAREKGCSFCIKYKLKSEVKDEKCVYYGVSPIFRAEGRKEAQKNPIYRGKCLKTGVRQSAGGFAKNRMEGVFEGELISKCTLWLNSGTCWNLRQDLLMWASWILINHSWSLTQRKQ